MMINNRNHLKTRVDKCINLAMKQTRDEIFRVLSKAIDYYYQEKVFLSQAGKDTMEYTNEPLVYERTYRLRDSLFASPVVSVSGFWTFNVGFPDYYLSYRYPGTPEWKKNVPATGKNVLEWLDSGLHGYTVPGYHRFWTEAINALNERYGSITGLFKIKLKQNGMPVK